MAGRGEIIWNPYQADYFLNPYPHLKQCRTENPIHKGVHGSWMFFKHEHVSEILRSNNFEVSELSSYFSEKEPYIFKNTDACPYLAQGTKNWPMYLNGSSHKQVRVAMGKALNACDLEKVIGESVLVTNEKFSSSQSFDLVEYCGDYIFDIIRELFGISGYGSIESIKKYSNMLAISQDLFIPKQVYQQINDWLLWGKDIFNDSSYKEIIKNHLNGVDAKYTDDDVYSILAISVMAAFETSKDNLTVALHEILKKQDLIDFVEKCDANELNVFIEECFRFSSPLQYTVRVNKAPLSYGNIVIPENSKLYLSIASANRDPEVFAEPDSFIPDRSPNNHLSFGGGVHFCLGASIARLEMRYCLKPMVAFLKNYSTPNEDGGVKWARQIFMRTVESAMLKRWANG